MLASLPNTAVALELLVAICSDRSRAGTLNTSIIKIDVVVRAGLTKTIATLSRQGSFWKALEVYEALPAAGLVPDTPIANAALSASNRGVLVSCLASAAIRCDRIPVCCAVLAVCVVSVRVQCAQACTWLHAVMFPDGV